MNRLLFLIVIIKKVNPRADKIKSGKNGPLTKRGTIRINKIAKTKSNFVSKLFIILFNDYFANLSIKFFVDLSMKKSDP